MSGSKVSIGILAWNEESSISWTVDSVLGQSLLVSERAEKVEIICVANGCTDATAVRARQALEHVGRLPLGPEVCCRVEEIATPSKENAWNRFVHEFSQQDADYLVLMDGDAAILHPKSLESMVETLESDPMAHIAGARTVKHIATNPRKSLADRISLGASRIRSARRGEFAGCLYCARTAALRAFRLPDVLVGEDSFIGAMIKTDFFTHPGDPRRIVAAPDATVLFQSYQKVGQVLRNLRRRAVGLTINSMLYDELWSNATPERHGGILLEEWYRGDPEFGRELIRRKVRERGLWVLPPGMVLKWFGRLRELPLKTALFRLPVALVATALQLYACLAANRLIRLGRLENLWFTSHTDPVATGLRSEGPEQRRA